MNLSKHIVSAIALVTCFMICTLSQAQPTKLAAKATKNTTQMEVASLLLDDDGMAANIESSVVHQYQCELNDSLTLYTNPNDDMHAALRWKNKLYRLTRVETTTGANRFENKKAGLVWIGIPTKSMLMDSIRGEQLTNECVITQP